MAAQEQKAWAFEDAANDAMNAFQASSKNFQAIAGEIFEISQQSFEHVTKTMDKLRHAQGLDEVFAIQTDFMRGAFEQAFQNTKKFNDLMAAWPAGMAKSYQDLWQKPMDGMVKATETAGQTAMENIERLSDAARKASTVFDRRESA